MNARARLLERLTRDVVAQGLPNVNEADVRRYVEAHQDELARHFAVAVNERPPPHRLTYAKHGPPRLNQPAANLSDAARVLRRARSLSESEGEAIIPILAFYDLDVDWFGTRSELEEYLDGDPLIARDELAYMIGAPELSERAAAEVMHIAVREASGVIPSWTARGLILEYLRAANSQKRLQVHTLPLARAEAFIRRYHSHLPSPNLRGLLFAIGATWNGTLVSVATAGTPTGRWRGRRGCPPGGILELTRVASVGRITTVNSRGATVPVSAASKLVATMIDLLEVSGRRTDGCLFVTYSLESESHTTYLSLADKGLRPVASVRGRQAGGQRRGAVGTAQKRVDKIRWEAGPAALDPDWSTLLRAGESLSPPPARLRGPMRAFEAISRRQADDN